MSHFQPHVSLPRTLRKEWSSLNTGLTLRRWPHVRLWPLDLTACKVESCLRERDGGSFPDFLFPAKEEVTTDGQIRNPTFSPMADLFCVFGDLRRCSFPDSISCIHSSGSRIFPLAKAPTWRVAMTCRLRRDVNNPVEPWESESFFALRRLDRLKTTQHRLLNSGILSSCRPAGIFILSFHFVLPHFSLGLTSALWDLYLTFFCCWCCIDYLMSRCLEYKEQWSDSPPASTRISWTRPFFFPLKGLEQLVELNCWHTNNQFARAASPKEN